MIIIAKEDALFRGSSLQILFVNVIKEYASHADIYNLSEIIVEHIHVCFGHKPGEFPAVKGVEIGSHLEPLALISLRYLP
jgi:hypothetical protein